MFESKTLTLHIFDEDKTRRHCYVCNRKRYITDMQPYPADGDNYYSSIIWVCKGLNEHCKRPVNKSINSRNEPAAEIGQKSIGSENNKKGR